MTDTLTTAIAGTAQRRLLVPIALWSGADDSLSTSKQSREVFLSAPSQSVSLKLEAHCRPGRPRVCCALRSHGKIPLAGPAGTGLLLRRRVDRKFNVLQ